MSHNGGALAFKDWLQADAVNNADESDLLNLRMTLMHGELQESESGEYEKSNGDALLLTVNTGY